MKTRKPSRLALYMLQGDNHKLVRVDNRFAGSFHGGICNALSAVRIRSKSVVEILSDMAIFIDKPKATYQLYVSVRCSLIIKKFDNHLVC